MSWKADRDSGKQKTALCELSCERVSECGTSSYEYGLSNDTFCFLMDLHRFPHPLHQPIFMSLIISKDPRNFNSVMG